MPQSARLSAGGGCNRYLGNAQIEVPLILMGLPLGCLIIVFKTEFCRRLQEGIKVADSFKVI